VAKSLRGLVGPVARKNGWQVAKAVGDATPEPHAVAALSGRWKVDAARDRWQAFGCESLGDPEGIGNLGDPIEMRLDGEPLKKGVASVGVP